ncbi:acyl transferase/acyl hydrolase/lysophospholipase, partial [Mycena belliarum]
DAGGIHATSMLLILKELFNKKKMAMHPHQYFDVIAGSGTGGILALMLGRLKMSINDTILAWADFASFFASVNTVDGKLQFNTEAFETLIKKVVQHYSKSQDKDEHMNEIPTINGFVCAREVDPKTNILTPVLLRTYNTPSELASTCKIWEAARATSAYPDFFPEINTQLGNTKVTYIDAGPDRHNPILELLHETEVLFPKNYTPCVISIGAGGPISSNTVSTIRLPPSLALSLHILACNCEDTAHKFVSSHSSVNYSRFNFAEEPTKNQDYEYKQDDISLVAHLMEPYFKKVNFGMFYIRLGWSSSNFPCKMFFGLLPLLLVLLPSTCSLCCSFWDFIILPLYSV